MHVILYKYTNENVVRNVHKYRRRIINIVCKVFLCYTYSYYDIRNKNRKSKKNQ